MSNELYIAGTGLASTYGVVITLKNSFALPERDRTTYEIPGRSGVLCVDNGRWKSVDMKFTIGGHKDAMKQAMAIILANPHNVEIRDSEHSAFHRIGCLKGGITPDSMVNNALWSCDVTYECDPRWIGEVVETIGAGGTSGALKPASEYIGCLYDITIPAGATLTMNGMVFDNTSTTSITFYGADLSSSTDGGIIATDESYTGGVFPQMELAASMPWSMSGGSSWALDIRRYTLT